MIKKSLKILVKHFDNGFIEQFGAAIISLNFTGFLCNLSNQYIWGNFLPSSETVELKFFDKNSTSWLTISFCSS